jgi:heme oxygenase
MVRVAAARQASVTAQDLKFSLRYFLREQTAASHHRVDTAVGDWESLDDYRRYLKSQFAFRHAMEAALADLDAPQDLQPFTRRVFAPLVRQDMIDLGDNLTPMPAPARLGIGLDNRSTLLGMLYVLEGAALGARLLVRRAEALGLNAAHGARHLAAQAGDKLGWPQFVTLLEAEDRIDAEAAVEGADAAFAVAQRAFAGAGR